MLIANHCKVPRIEEAWRLHQDKWEIETGLLPGNFTVNNIEAKLVGCYQAVPHCDDAYQRFWFVTLVAQSYHHVLSDATAYPKEYALAKGDLVIVDPEELHWLYQEQESSSRFRRRGYWLGIQWEVPKQDLSGSADVLKSFVKAVVDQFHGQWTHWPGDARYAYLLPS